MKTINQLAVTPGSTGQSADQIRKLKTTEMFCRHRFRKTLWVLLHVPVVVMSQDQENDENMQREWLEIQSNASKKVKWEWWRHLDVEQLNTYLEAGAEVNVADRRKWTPLHFAARHNPDPEVLAALLQAGAVVNARNRTRETPLHWAAAENTNVEILTSLIAAGADVNARDRFGWLPIHTAAEGNSNPEVIEVLLAAGSKRNKRAYYVFFRPVFLLKHNSNMSDPDKKTAMALLKKPD